MKYTPYSLRLDSPCSQPWDSMTPTTTGRHCGLCAKNVVDLTHLTDDQILTILKKSDSTFCGRVTDTQELIERIPMPLTQPPTEQEAFEAKKRDDPDYMQHIRVTGRVLARETQQPVAGVSVMVQGAGHTAVTEADGSFHILLPDSLFTQSFRFHTLHRDYGSVRTTTTVQDFPSLIELPPPRPVVTISGGGLVVVKRKWWQWRRKKEEC